MDRNTEHDRIEEAKRGESAAIAALYQQYWPAARAVAYGATGDLTLAEDAASEAFSAAMSNLNSLQDAHRFGPWLRTIVVRTARRLKAACAARNAAESHQAHPRQISAPSKHMEQCELADLIREAVGGLPGGLREAISLFYFEGYSVKAAAGFLGVTSGTFKRRLHDGRHRLQTSAYHILKGGRPMNRHSKETLQQLQKLIDESGDSDSVYRVIREALGLRPIPADLLNRLVREHNEAIHGPVLPEEIAEKMQRVRKHWEEFAVPSKDALDPEHPLGETSAAIRAALPDFEQWPENASPDSDIIMRASRQKDNSAPLPPGFAGGDPVSYWRVRRGMLFQDKDGSVYTLHGLFQEKASRQDFETVWTEGFCISDVLELSWPHPKPLELREIEWLLRRLCDAVVPGARISFTSYDEPGYRSALRMRLEDFQIPAVIGGVVTSRPGLSEDAELANVRLHLECWASVRCKHPYGLTRFPFSLLE